MLKRVLESRRNKALLVLPYVALVQEKVRWLRRLVSGVKYSELLELDGDGKESLWCRRADEDSIRVVGFFGGGKIRSTWHDFDIAICTLEKVSTQFITYCPDHKADTYVQANTLINTAIDDCSILQLKAVVLDELHMIDDDHRGYLLELIGAKLLSLDQSVQIIGMSATLPVSYSKSSV